MFGALRRLREAQVLKHRAIPDALWSSTVERYPFLSQRDAADLAELRRLATLFLAEKEFHGAHGFEVTDAVAVAIAAQACLPILRLGLQWYDGFVGIVVHADEVVARRKMTDDDGVVHHYDEELTGEAMVGGPLMLTWHDVASAGETARWGYNVVIHEFAHVIDMRDGIADGVPSLEDPRQRAAWQRMLDAAYEGFCRSIDAGEDSFLDPYGSEAPEEFFAVTVEAFFVSPDELRAEQPDLFEAYVALFRQRPLGGGVPGETAEGPA